MERELNESETEKALNATGDKVADAAGLAADKSKGMPLAARKTLV